MKKIFIAVLSSIVLLALCLAVFTACECEHEFVNGKCTKCGIDAPAFDMSGISLEDKTVVYNGQNHTAAITGTLPQGLSVSYSYYSDEAHTQSVEKVTNAGTYYVVATFSCDGTHTTPAALSAKLVVSKATYDMSGVKLENKTVDYNGKAQTLAVTGNLPDGVTVAYEYYTDDAYTTKVNEAVNAGTYYVKAIFTGDSGNYDVIAEAKATLTINKIAYGAVDFVVSGEYGSDSEKKTADARFEGEGLYFLEYAPATTYELKVSSATEGGKPAKTSVKWFIDAALTTEVNPLDVPSLTNIGDSLYVQVKFADDNHSDSKTLVREITLAKKTFELKTYDDLLLMRAHIYGDTEKGIDAMSASVRMNVRYILLNNIDCEGRVWTPVSYMMTDGNDYATNSFCSEFDGKGYTISNYKITEASFDADTLNSAAIKILYVGFFGRVNNGIMYGGEAKSDADLDKEACNIHDITFDNVQIKLDAKSDDYKFDADVAIYAGFVIGYTNCGNWNTLGRLNLYNITVQNSTIDIDAYKSHVGGIIGYENIAYAYAGLRQNLTVQDCAIYAVSSKGATGTSVYLGGIVGREKAGVSETPDNEATWWARYHDCSVKNVKLGWNYEAWSNATTPDEKALYAPVSGNNTYVGLFFGSLESTSMTLKNFVAENYLIAHTNDGFYTGLVGNFTSSNYYNDNVTESVNAEWNNGVNGIYGVPNDEGNVSQQEVDKTTMKWIGNAVAEGGVMDALNRKEAATRAFLGLDD